MRQYYFSHSSKSMLSALNVRLREALLEAINESPVDFGIVSPTGGYRTKETQEKLYHEGKSQLNGTTSKSFHQIGWAVDLFAYVDGKAVWDGKWMSLLAAHIIQVCSNRGLVVEWGGFWSNPDKPHFQVIAYYHADLDSEEESYKLVRTIEELYKE